MQQISTNIHGRVDSISLAGIRLGLRTTVVQLAEGRLWVHSPTHLTDALRRKVDALGEVGFLVAASNGHNRWLLEWQ
ncbi:MAG: hypothetical protein V3V08_04585 [Nannocystaceae bacterium]